MLSLNWPHSCYPLVSMAAVHDLWRIRPFLTNLSHPPVTGHNRLPPLVSAVSTQKLSGVHVISRKQEGREVRLDYSTPLSRKTKWENVYTNKTLRVSLMIGNTLSLFVSHSHLHSPTHTYTHILYIQIYTCTEWNRTLYQNRQILGVKPSLTLNSGLWNVSTQTKSPLMLLSLGFPPAMLDQP